MALIDTIYPSLFSKNVELAVQQKMAPVAAVIQNDNGDFKSKYYTFHNKREMSAYVARKPTTPDNDGDFTKVWIEQLPFVWTESFDQFDNVYLDGIVLPTSSTVQDAVAAINRQIDTTILAAALGNRIIGGASVGSGTPDALPAGQTIDVDYVESGSAVDSGLTIGKLRRASYILNRNEADMEGRYLVVSSSMLQDLLRTTEATNQDYNTVRALVDGSLNTFLGFNIIRSERLPASNGGVRSAVAFHKDGLKVATSKINTKMDERSDLSYAIQVYSTLSVGAVRLQNELVVDVECVEA